MDVSTSTLYVFDVIWRIVIVDNCIFLMGSHERMYDESFRKHQKCIVHHSVNSILSDKISFCKYFLFVFHLNLAWPSINGCKSFENEKQTEITLSVTTFDIGRSENFVKFVVDVRRHDAKNSTSCCQAHWALSLCVCVCATSVFYTPDGIRSVNLWFKRLQIQ